MKDKYFLKEKDYIKGISLMVRFCLDFVIVKDKKILLSKRKIEPYKGFWHFPGGMVRKGESVEEVAQRILKSELGLRPVSTKLLGYIEYLNEKIPSKKISTHSVSMVFKTKLEPGEIRGSFQAEDIEFFKKIPNKTIPEVKKFLVENKGLFC